MWRDLFDFTQTIRGKGEYLYFTMPIEYVRTYGLSPDPDWKLRVTFKKAFYSKQGFAQFESFLRKCGKEDSIIVSIPKKVTVESELKPGMRVVVLFEYEHPSWIVDISPSGVCLQLGCECGNYCIEIKTHGYPKPIYEPDMPRDKYFEQRFVCSKCGKEWIYDTLHRQIEQVPEDAHYHFDSDGTLKE